MTEKRESPAVPKADQSKSSESKARKGYDAATPINRPEGWRVVRRECEESVARELAQKDS